jgi:hypothetical protein
MAQSKAGSKNVLDMPKRGLGENLLKNENVEGEER